MLRTSVSVLCLFLAGPLLAQELSYNFVTGGYQRIELDDDLGLDVDGDNYDIGVSFEIGDAWYVFGGYGLGDFDFGVELDELALGGGYHVAVSNKVDFLVNLAYLRADLSAAGLSVDDDGYGISAGLRAMVSESVELSGSITYADFDTFGDDTSVDAAAWFNLTEKFALGLEAGAGDDVTSYGLGARIYFGN